MDPHLFVGLEEELQASINCQFIKRAAMSTRVDRPQATAAFSCDDVPDHWQAVFFSSLSEGFAIKLGRQSIKYRSGALKLDWRGK